MKTRKHKIVIINTVALNGGDEALLRSTILGLKKISPKSSLSFLSNTPDLCNEFFSDIYFDWDWEYAFKKRDLNENKILFNAKLEIRFLLFKFFKISYLSKISRFFASVREKRVYDLLSNSNHVLLAPGGYIHDFYGYKNRLLTCLTIKEHFKCNYHIFSQSIGPFWKKENYPDLATFFNNATSIILREQLSIAHLKKISPIQYTKASTDVAFYLYEHKKIAPKSKNTENIIMCFREWLNESDSAQILSKAVALCHFLIINNKVTLTFISTCQGIDGYKDDSLFAEKIINQLPPTSRGKCKVISQKLNLDELISIFSQHDAYIGMRLHGAILSMIAGLPAFNIAYEDKSIGIFGDLRLSNYCLHYEEDLDSWNKKIQAFINNQESIKKYLPKILQKMYNKSENNFQLLKEAFDE